VSFLFRHGQLKPIADRLCSGERLSTSEALWLFEHADLNELGALANLINQRKNGSRVSYIVNRYINYSNYCILSCKFCAFSRKRRDQDGFELSIEEVVQKAKDALSLGITELHIVGGLHPSLPFDYYLDLLRSLKALDNRLELKCFTAIEILHLAWLAKISVTEVLTRLKAAGLASLTGGGAEIFATEVRREIARGKESAEEYLDVHRTWHRLGGRSTCTMLYGHIESLRDRVNHLEQLRTLQDETHGFVGFVPLPFQPENNRIGLTHPPTGNDMLRTLSVSRLFLDNFDHITAYWVGMGLKMAQVALNYGADDIHGTIVEEHIFHMAGAKTPQTQTALELQRAISASGRIPVQRNTFYEPVNSIPACPESSPAVP
jgi:aminodeoxyfutalosine synthase